MTRELGYMISKETFMSLRFTKEYENVFSGEINEKGRIIIILPFSLPCNSWGLLNFTMATLEAPMVIFGLLLPAFFEAQQTQL